MAFQKQYHQKRNHMERPDRFQDVNELVHPESTGTEAAYFKSLIESHRKVTVNLKDGERLQGYIRYYDRYCFSVGLLTGNRKVFLRKENISFISED